MKFLFDIFPVILFFIAYKVLGNDTELAQTLLTHWPIDGVQLAQIPIMSATFVAIIASILQIVYNLMRKQRIQATTWISLIIICLFGGATIFFHNGVFIKWKPSILYWAFSAILFFYQYVKKRNLIYQLLSEQVAQLNIPQSAWNTINILWTVFFLLMGFINILIAYYCSESFWVNFKLFGLTGLLILFVIFQSIYLGKYLPKENTE